MERRGFLKRFAAGALGALVTLIPFGAGLAFFLDPLRRSKRMARGFARVTSIDALPVGVPRRFTITGDRSDAWNQYPNEPIGAVYLVRRESNDVEAFQVICPHAGCFVAYDSSTQHFRCPCHSSSFDLDGSIADAHSPAPRGLDALEVKQEGNDVLVRYQEFRQGTGQKVPVT